MTMTDHQTDLGSALAEALQLLARGESLTRQHAADVMELLMRGHAGDAEFAALLMGLAQKGESVDEITGMATVMRALAVPLVVDRPVVDTCGTGGDGSGTFNVSTVAAFVVAGAGATVAKHGNRAMSSQCGSADVLEAMGATVELDASAVAEVLAKSGIGFMFAPRFHPAMRHAMGVRRQLRIRTVFNLLGPITNPAGAKHQVLGVANHELAGKLVRVLRELGSDRALVVHGHDGLDELSIAAPTTVHDLRDGEIHVYDVTPEDAGLEYAPLETLRGGDRHENARIARSILEGECSPRRDVVVLNAAAALIAAGRVADLREGAVVAQASIDEGAALTTLDCFIELSNQALAQVDGSEGIA